MGLVHALYPASRGLWRHLAADGDIRSIKHGDRESFLHGAALLYGTAGPHRRDRRRLVETAGFSLSHVSAQHGRNVLPHYCDCAACHAGGIFVLRSPTPSDLTNRIPIYICPPAWLPGEFSS